MKHVYISRLNDQEIILNYQNGFRNITNKNLIQKYNDQVNCGIVGVHQQALFLLALRNEFIHRFGKSPVQIEDGIVVSLLGKVALLSGQDFKIIS